MAVINTSASAGPYVGNGVTTEFPFGFAAKRAGDVSVYVDEVKQASGFTVSLDTSDYQGGTVTFAVAPAAGKSVLLLSRPSMQHSVQLVEASGASLRQAMQDALDIAAIRDIALQDQIERTPKGDKGDKGEKGDTGVISLFVDDFIDEDTVAGRTEGFQATAAAANALGGGVVIDLAPGGDYIIGVQDFGPAITDPTNRFFKYTGVPAPLMEFKDCAKPITIRMNGAAVRLAAGLKYGVFDEFGVAVETTLPYFGEGISAYYDAIFLFENCGAVTVENGELDGSMDELELGGGWGDTGYQLGGCGTKYIDCTGPIREVNLHSHHHPSDGLHVRGKLSVNVNSDESVFFQADQCRYNRNGRLGVAIVGGRGFTLNNCQTNYNANNAETGSIIQSAPMSGIDIEPDAGRPVRDVRLNDHESIGNGNTQLVADSGDTRDIVVRKSRFISTVPGSACVWPNKPGMKFYDCLMAGTNTNLYRSASEPSESVYFEGCKFSNADEFSPTGVLATNNRLLFDSPLTTGITMRRCTFDFAKAGASANFSTDLSGPFLIDSTIIARDDPTGGGVFPAVNGRYRGFTEFVESGDGSIQTVPKGGRNDGANPSAYPFKFKGDSGHSEGMWAYTPAGGPRAVYPATLNQQGKEVIVGVPVTWDPPSIAAGAVQSTTVVAPGATVGMLAEVAFTVALGGTRLWAEVTAANTVTVYHQNPTGGAVDLASGSLRVKVTEA